MLSYIFGAWSFHNQNKNERIINYLELDQMKFDGLFNEMKKKKLSKMQRRNPHVTGLCRWHSEMNCIYFHRRSVCVGKNKICFLIFFSVLFCASLSMDGTFDCGYFSH